MTIYQSYTYFMKWTIHDKKYYGVRTANECEPENDLWHEYQSSSEDTKEFIKEHGKPDILYVDKTFDDPEEAWAYEVKILQENDVVNDDSWLNKTDCHAPPRLPGEKNAMFGKKGKDHPVYGRKHTPDELKRMSESQKGKRAGENHPNFGKTYEELYGDDKASDIKQRISEANGGENSSSFGKTYEEIHGEEKGRLMRENLRKRMLGADNHFRGKRHSPESIEIMREKAKNRPPASYETKAKRKKSISKGDYITPWGVFISMYDAADACPVFISSDSVTKYCKRNSMIITRQMIVRSDYLTEDMFGKTLKELGFDFKPKQ